MININLPLGWDALGEKTVQSAIHHKYPLMKREVSLGGCFCDFTSPSGRTVIELKKASSDKGSRYLTRPHHSIGQVLYYQSVMSSDLQQPLETITPVLLLFGSDIRKWITEDIRAFRQRHAVKLWAIVSLQNPHIIDLDSGAKIDLDLLD